MDSRLGPETSSGQAFGNDPLSHKATARQAGKDEIPAGDRGERFIAMPAGIKLKL